MPTERVAVQRSPQTAIKSGAKARCFLLSELMALSCIVVYVITTLFNDVLAEC